MLCQPGQCQPSQCQSDLSGTPPTRGAAQQMILRASHAVRTAHEKGRRFVKRRPFAKSFLPTVEAYSAVSSADFSAAGSSVVAVDSAPAVASAAAAASSSAPRLNNGPAPKPVPPFSSS